MLPKTIILADFDGTVNLDDTQIALFEAFAHGKWEDLDKEWIDGNLSTPDQFAMLFPQMQATREQMEAVLATLRLDPALPALLAWIEQKGWQFAILSDGLEWAIAYMLRRAGIDGITIYANRMHFTPEGLRLEYPWRNALTPMRGVCKATIIQRYQSQGYRVILVGDGVSDVEAARYADIVYARAHLWEYCAREGIGATRFERLGDLLQQWQSDPEAIFRSAKQ